MVRNMRREKRANKYIGIIITATLCVVLTACGLQDEGVETADSARQNEETYNCPVQELNSYLLNYETDCPYVSADIIIDGYSAESPEDFYLNHNISFTGDAEVTWQFYNSLGQMESALQAQETGAETDETFRLSYYAFPWPENLHALDLYNILKERYDSEEHPFMAISLGIGDVYQFTQETYDEDGYIYHHRSEINLVIKDGIIYGYSAKSIPDTYTDGELNLLFSDYLNCLDDHSYSGWVLDEEGLYWIDHEERIIEIEEPDRSFVEVRGIDTNWEEAGNMGIMRYFAMLREADYEVPLTEDGPMLDIHFTFAEKPSEEGYRYYLWNGNCMDEDYYMTVTDQKTGKVLQESKVQLSIELPDTIAFVDLNADGYADMRIDNPYHSSGERAVMGSWSSRDCLLWNPQEEQFEYKTEKEVQNSLLANQSGLTEEEQAEKTKKGSTEYIVQPGDCLWSISERFLGSGSDWTKLWREENAPEDPDYILPGEIIRIPEKN